MAERTEQLEPYFTHMHESLWFSAAVSHLYDVWAQARAEPDSALGRSHQEFAELLEEEGAYGADPHTYFVARLFLSRVASFEVFLQETLALVIRKHPKKVGHVEFRLSDVVGAGQTSVLIDRAAEEVLNKLMYKKPLEYLAAVCELLSIDRAPLEDDWKVFVEAKARRDLGMHNAWRCNAIYLRKLEEAKINSALKLGDNAAPDYGEYLRKVDEALDRISDCITELTLQKHWPELNWKPRREGE